jgi:O-succinylhomoserine sulfhydrylase
MDGQGRVLGGAVLGRKKWIDEVYQPFFRNTGPTMSPFNAWVILKGLETMGIRVAAQSANALAVAEFLASSPKISRAIYPALKTHPQRELAAAQMSGGGTLVTFELEGGKDAAFKLLNALRIISISDNLGDTKSLATHPATTTHMRIGPEERARLGITDGIVRLSVGLEDARDLIDDLRNGLDAI